MHDVVLGDLAPRRSPGGWTVPSHLHEPGVLQAEVSLGYSFYGSAFVLADLDRDGLPDALSSGHRGGEYHHLFVFKGDGTGGFSLVGEYPTEGNSFNLAVLDFDARGSGRGWGWPPGPPRRRLHVREKRAPPPALTPLATGRERPPPSWRTEPRAAWEWEAAREIVRRDKLRLP
jgi:hypothetical protein